MIHCHKAIIGTHEVQLVSFLILEHVSHNDIKNSDRFTIEREGIEKVPDLSFTAVLSGAEIALTGLKQIENRRK